MCQDYLYPCFPCQLGIPAPCLAEPDTPVCSNEDPGSELLAPKLQVYLKAANRSVPVYNTQMPNSQWGLNPNKSVLPCIKLKQGKLINCSPSITLIERYAQSFPPPGLSAGHISKVVIGDNKHQYFLVIGRAVDEVRLAQNLAKASEVILSPKCWELCNRNMIEIETIKDQRSVKVGNVDLPSAIESIEFPPLGILRATSTLSPNDELEKSLRKYVMRNILEKLVTIVFVNLQFDESANTLHLCKAIHDANVKISNIIHVFSGKINKVFMFDKGCTFLCVFGLPGDKQADESAHALDSAFKIFNFCSEMLMKIKLVSIGVTSGPVFCGVVGHHVRHEYTVIGQKVNLTARMMMYYPGLVSLAL
uniref:Guanylate cyclase domain-containing protein n=1 Tax=Chrysemys picta bellii TaxID=8478 RepID=A0A8C3H6P0_CHRPI